MVIGINSEGSWQTKSNACAGTYIHPSEPGHLYTFRLTATNHVGIGVSTTESAAWRDPSGFGNPKGLGSSTYPAKHYYANRQRVDLTREG